MYADEILHFLPQRTVKVDDKNGQIMYNHIRTFILSYNCYEYDLVKFSFFSL